MIHECKDNLESIARTTVVLYTAPDDDAEPYLEFFKCNVCDKLYYVDNPGIPGYSRAELYTGEATMEKIQKVLTWVTLLSV